MSGPCPSPLPFRRGAESGGYPHSPRDVASPHPNPSREGEGLKRVLVLGLFVLLCGCSEDRPPAAPLCPANLELSASAPSRGMPVEDTPAGQCLAARALAGDLTAAVRLGEFYSALPGTVPLIDRRGRQVHWYRLAADHGSPLGAWRASRLIDIDPDRQVPNDALSYLFVAVKGQVPEAGDYLVDQWQAGRIDPGKLWALRRWLGKPGALPDDQRTAMIAGLNAPTDELEPE